MNKWHFLIGAALIILAVLAGMVLALWNQPAASTQTSQVSTTPVVVGCLPCPTRTPVSVPTPFTLTPKTATPAPTQTPGPPAPTSTFVVPTLVHPLTEEEVLKLVLEIDMRGATDWDDPWCLETLQLQPGRITFSKENSVWIITITGNVSVMLIGIPFTGPVKAGGIEYHIDQKTGWLLGMGTLISEEQAINIAVKDASTSRPELSAAQSPPAIIGTTQMNLAAAERLLTGRAGVPTAYDPNMIVWVVSMEGIWLDLAPRPEGFPMPEPYRHFAVIINSRTGQVIGASARP